MTRARSKAGLPACSAEPSRGHQAAGWFASHGAGAARGSSGPITIPPMMPSQLYGPSLLLALAACAAPTDRPALPETSWRIDAEPVLQIGGETDDTLALLGNAVAAFRVDDSLIVVADRGYNSLRYFDMSGTLRDSVGREGDGPGEFKYIARAFFCGDTLFVQDIQHRRFEAFGAEGTHVRKLEQAAPPGASFGAPYKMSCGPTGTWIANAWDTLSPGEPHRARAPVPYWLLDPDGKVMTLLGDHPGSERLVTMGGSGPFPLGKEPVMAIGATRAYIGSADSLTILVYDLAGNALDPISMPYQDLATTEADRERYRLLDTLGQEQDEIDRNVREWQTFEFPPTVPAYTALLLDRQDNLWVRLFPRSDENLVRWLVFSPEGESVGQLDLPGTLEVHDIGADYILGVETQLEGGSQQVRQYRLHRD